MKLGIKIVFTSGGVQDGPIFNNDEFLAKYAADVRPFLKRVFPTREELRSAGRDPLKSFDESSKIVYMLQFLGAGGYLLTLIKAGPEQTGRTFDNTAAWIHVPIDADVTAAQMKYVLDEIGAVLSDKSDIDPNRLSAVANIEYQQSKALTQTILSQGENISVLAYGTGTNYELHELLGASIYQPIYAQYRAIFLLDSRLGIDVLGNAMMQNVKIKQIVTINCPNDYDGFKPYLGDMPFTRPVNVCKGQTLTITWKKKNFRDIIQDVNTSDEANVSGSRPKAGEMDVLFQRNWFDVRDEQGNQLPQAKIAINNKPFNADGTLAVNKETLNKPYKVTVSCQGYSTFSEKYTDIQRRTITLKHNVYRYEFTITGYDDDGDRLSEPIKAVLETTQELTESPIKGYEVAGNLYEGEGHMNKNRLIYKDSIMEKAKFAGIGAAVVALLWGIVAFFSNYEFAFAWPPIQKKDKVEATGSNGGDKPGQRKNVTNEGQEGEGQNDEGQNGEGQNGEGQNGVKSIVEDPSKAEAIEYLKNNLEAWKKAEMDNIPYLKGLYDDVNTYNFNSLKENWVPKLNNDFGFRALMDVVNKCIANNVAPSGSYSPDGTITIARYKANLEKKLPKETDTKKTDNKKTDNKKTDNNKPQWEQVE